MNHPHRHIALILLVVLHLGGIVAPFVHSLSHYAAKQRVHFPENQQHVHPDATSMLDNSQHQFDTDLECVLCNTTSVYYLASGYRTHESLSLEQCGAYASPCISNAWIEFPRLRGPPLLPLSDAQEFFL